MSDVLVVDRERVGTALLAGGAPTAAALLDGDEIITYGELTERVARRHDELALAERSLVVLRASNSIEFVTTYLAVLAGDHVPLLAGDHAEQLAATWAADALVDVDGDELHVVRRPGTAEREYCTRNWPCCSARPARPGRRNWSGCRTPTC